MQQGMVYLVLRGGKHDELRDPTQLNRGELLPGEATTPAAEGATGSTASPRTSPDATATTHEPDGHDGYREGVEAGV